LAKIYGGLARMKFRDWASLDEIRYGGFYRQFRTDNPQMPDHVAKDLYNNRVGYSMKRLLNTNNPVEAPTQPFTGSGSGMSRSSGSALPSDTPSKIIDSHNLKNIQWSQRPMPITITPLSFDDWTISIMVKRRFGLLEDKGIRDDANRMQIQRNLMPQAPTGENEPIIVLKVGNKFKLLEGWHRTMNYLVFDHNEHIGAPPDQIEILKHGNMSNLDFTRWQPVLIKAFVGSEMQNSAQQ
jgi:hypothetical protein